MLICTGCAKTALITIRMRVAGREIVFHRCSKCEANTWQDDAAPYRWTRSWSSPEPVASRIRAAPGPRRGRVKTPAPHG